jgi:D-xylose transport system substrate-binding protein
MPATLAALPVKSPSLWLVAAMMDAGEGAVEWTSPGGTTMTSMFLAPQPITAENLSVVVDAGWIELDALCQGVVDGPAPCN